jgi:hypothetical protein
MSIEDLVNPIDILALFVPLEGSAMNWTRMTSPRSRHLSLVLALAALTEGSSCRQKEAAVAPTPAPPKAGPVSDGILEGLQKELAASRTLNLDAAERVKFVRPVLKCVEVVSKTEWRAHFGYVSTSKDELAISVGLFNRFWPPPLDRSQPTVFGPGSRDDVARVAFNPLGSTAWVLGSDFVLADAHSPPCPAKR